MPPPAACPCGHAQQSECLPLRACANSSLCYCSQRWSHLHSTVHTELEQKCTVRDRGVVWMSPAAFRPVYASQGGSKSHRLCDGIARSLPARLRRHQMLPPRPRCRRTPPLASATREPGAEAQPSSLDLVCFTLILDDIGAPRDTRSENTMQSLLACRLRRIPPTFLPLRTLQSCRRRCPQILPCCPHSWEAAAPKHCGATWPPALRSVAWAWQRGSALTCHLP